MTLSINCKDVGDIACNHTMYGQTEEQLLELRKKMDIQKRREKKKFLAI